MGRDSVSSRAGLNALGKSLTAGKRRKGGKCRANRAACRAASTRRSVSRARAAVRDLARSNPWRFFVTLTLSPEKVNRYDPVDVLRHLRHWLGNNVRRKGLVYLLVPEHHKDGAIHFHGLFNDALEAVDSGHKDGKGHTVYNLPGWGWGFSTAIELYGERDAAVNYVCKYIGKQLDGSMGGTPEKIGGRWYYSGGNLARPAVSWVDVDIRDWEGVGEWRSVMNLPWLKFITVRVSANGEILGKNTAEVRTQDAEHGSGGVQPPTAGDATAADNTAGPSFGQTVGPRQTSSRDGDAPPLPLVDHFVYQTERRRRDVGCPVVGLGLSLHGGAVDG